MRYAKKKYSYSFRKSMLLPFLLLLYVVGSADALASEKTELDLGTVDQITIGSTTLSIKHPDEKTIAAYKSGDNEPLFQGERSDFQEPAGIVKYRLQSDGSEAALLELHNAGEIDETNFILLIDQKGTGLQKILFGSNSITFGGKGTVSKIQNRLHFERPAYPHQAGVWMEWSFEKGLKTGDIVFEPKDHRSLNTFYESKVIKSLEPLDNADFYQAVMKLPIEDRRRVLTSMSGLSNLNADSSGMVETDRYGLRKTRHLLAFSSCGIAYDGQMLNCFGNDSLAIWERKTGKFYFAVNFSPDNVRYNRDDNSVHFYPSVDTWTRSAKSQLHDWQSDAVWSDK